MKRAGWVICFFMLLKLILQYLAINPIYELHRDEFLHLDQAKHLAWGFQSVPPVTSWISWVILQLGNSYILIKFFPALFGALTILIVWKTVESLKGSFYACVLSAIALTFSSLIRINILYQPNSLDILCWTLFYYTFIRFIQTENYKWLYFMAISFAIGFLNKYNIVFCLLGLLPAILLTNNRKLFLKPQFYFAILLALVLISPNLIWQFQNDFPVFKHLKELNDTQLVHVERMDFVKEQILFFLGSLLIIVTAFIGLFTYPPFKPYRVLFFAYVFTIIIFIFLKAKAYYAIGLYPIFIAFGAIYLSELLQHGWKYYLRYLPIAIILLFFMPMLKISFPLQTPASYEKAAAMHKPFSEHKWEDGKTHPIAQDFADMLGWRELARKTDSVYLSIPDKQHVFILCDNYGEAGAINYYTKIKGLTANSFNADYLNWLNLDSPIYTMIRIKELKNNSLTREKTLFKKLSFSGEIESTYAREKGTTIVLLEQPKTAVNKLLKQAADQLKD